MFRYKDSWSILIKCTKIRMESGVLVNKPIIIIKIPFLGGNQTTEGQLSNSRDLPVSVYGRAGSVGWYVANPWYQYKTRESQERDVLTYAGSSFYREQRRKYTNDSTT